MATSSRLKNLNPQKLWLVMTISGVLLLVLATVGGIFLGLKQNQSLVQSENKMILRRNGELLLHQNIRTFVESLGFDEREYRLSIESELDHQRVNFGKLDRTNLIQCSTEIYFQYEVELCRPPPLSWLAISVIFAVFLFLIGIVALIVRRLGIEIVTSFQDLFRVAKINAPSEMNFNLAWTTAFSMAHNFSESQKKLILAEKDRAIIDLSRQVAHDIRSPLTALNFLAASLDEVSQEKRALAKQAIGRIGDIANNLLQKSKTSTVHTNIRILIEQVIAQKNLEFQNRIQISFKCESDEMWTQINAGTLGRIVSNLINNSLEAEARNIKITLWNAGSNTEITILDDGRGIPTEIISKLGHSHFSTKTTGNGLGMIHAKSEIENSGGSFSISSQLGKGTDIKIILTS